MSDVYDEVVPKFNSLYRSFYDMQQMLFKKSLRRKKFDYDELFIEATTTYDHSHEIFVKHRDTDINPLLIDAMDALNDATNWIAVYLAEKGNLEKGFGDEGRTHRVFNELYKSSRRLTKAAKKIS